MASRVRDFRMQNPCSKKNGNFVNSFLQLFLNKMIDKKCKCVVLATLIGLCSAFAFQCPEYSVSYDRDQRNPHQMTVTFHLDTGIDRG